MHADIIQEDNLSHRK